MSAKSIKLFQQAHPRLAPTLQARLRAEALALRIKAQSLLAQASRIDAMADELDGK